MAHGLILAVIQVSLQASEIPTMIAVFFNTWGHNSEYVCLSGCVTMIVTLCAVWSLGSLSRFLFPTGSTLHCCSCNLHIMIRVMMDLSFMITTVVVAVMGSPCYLIVRMYISMVKVGCSEVTHRHVQQR